MAAGRLLLPSWMPALDSDGNPIPNAKVFFYNNLTTTLAPVFSDEALATPLANPVEANASGRFPAVWADDATLYSASVEAPYGPAGVPFTYDNLSVSIGADILIAGAAEAAADEAEASADSAAQSLAEINDIIENAPDAPSVANKADKDGLNVIADIFKQGARITAPNISAAKALSPGATRSIFVESRASLGDGYGGVFEWATGNQSASVSADPSGGVWLAPSSSPSGSSGAWRRIFNGAIDASWFGGRTSAAINTALSYAKTVGAKTVVAIGDYVMSSTVEYEGGTDDGLMFDGSLARFLRTGDYGPTFYVHGIPSGAALQRVKWLLGQIVDVDRSMTVAGSRSHVIFDTVYFLEWGVGPILGGSGGIELLGCSSVANATDFTARFDGTYKPGSVGFNIGPSEITGYAGTHGGDTQINGLIDIYGGSMIAGLTGSTSGSSTTVTVSNGAGIAVGDLIAGIGLEGNEPYALIPQGTTVTNVVGNTVTISTAVTLPGGYQLVFFRPAIEDGFRVSAIDGLWGKGFVHSIFCGRRSISITPTGSSPIDNVRLDVMPDFSPGVGFYMAGAGTARHGHVNIHNAYAESVDVTATRQGFTIESQDGRWSLDGFRYGSTVEAPRMTVDGGAGFAEREWRKNGSLRYNLYMDNSAESSTANGSGMGLNVHDNAGAYLGTAWTIDRNARTVKHTFPIQYDGVSVATLATLTYMPAGTFVYCFDCRVLQAGGALQGAGTGSGSLVQKAGDTNWYVVGTNVIAQS